MSDLYPYTIEIEQDLGGRWHWSVIKAPYGTRGPFLYVEGFFRDYGYGSEKTKDKAERKAREFVARHSVYSRKLEKDRARRERTRVTLT